MSRRNYEVAPERARDVLAYFLRNPGAADSLEGVARWRLMNERVHRGIEEVHQTLGWLVAEGFLLEEPVMGSATIFRLNPKKVAQAARFLGEPQGHESGE